jgi:CBS domain-containing protein
MIRVTQMLPDARSRLFLIEDDRPLTDAASLLADTTRHMVLVCNRNGVMVGVVTRTDIVRQIRHCEGCACTTPCVEVMTREVTSCCPDDSLHEVWATMKSKSLKGIPIIDAERRPIGLVLARDALEMLLSEAEHEGELLKEYVNSVGYH